jgi:pantoate kinase
LFRAAEYIPGKNMEAGGLGGLGLLARDAQKGLRGAGQQIAMLSTNPIGVAAQFAPATAGLGLGAMGGSALGQAMAIDPEMPGSSNTLGSRMNMQQYPVMY